MPWRTLCGFPPTAETVTLRVPNRAWRPDTVITDYEGNEMFVLLDQTNEMRSYEAVFGDLEGRRLVCIKRHLAKEFWKDGYYFCTYQPNWAGQPALTDRDVDNKRVYPFSYLQITAMKGRFFYRLFNNDQTTGPPRMMAENPWLGFMVVCCTPSVRCGKWSARFKKTTSGKTTITVDQWRNVVDVGPGNDLLAALCMAYIFDRYQCQPFITVFGRKEEDEYEQGDESIGSDEDPYYEDDDDDERRGLVSNSDKRNNNDDDPDGMFNDYHDADDDHAYDDPNNQQQQQQQRAAPGQQEHDAQYPASAGDEPAAGVDQYSEDVEYPEKQDRAAPPVAAAAAAAEPDLLSGDELKHEQDLLDDTAVEPINPDNVVDNNKPSEEPFGDALGPKEIV